MNISKITLIKIKKSFIQGDNSLLVLNEISMRFQKGMSYALVGVSGSGKSTLLHIIGCLDDPTEGMVCFDGVPYTQLSPLQKALLRNQSLGMIFQLPYLIDELTVLENVMIKGLMSGMPKKKCVQEAQNLLSDVGIADKITSYPSELSGGQQQRVAIARALLNKPDFIIADEPTGNLDSKTAQEIVELLISCAKQGLMGLIISSHDRNIAYRMENLLQLDRGRLLPYQRENFQVHQTRNTYEY
jgi:ABC-type lipoprotein export system ATPase subunit